MSDGDTKPTLTRKPLGLKRSVETGEVKQTFSHGRTNKVVVEVKRRKLAPKTEAAEAAPPPPPPPPPAVAPRAPAAGPRGRTESEQLLSRQEFQSKLLREAEEARLTMGEEARVREEQERARQAEADARRADEKAQAAEIEAVAEAAEPAAEVRPADVEASTAPTASAEAAREAAASLSGAASRAMPPPRRFTPVQAPPPPTPKPAPAPTPEPQAEEKRADKKPERPKAADRRQAGKLTVNQALAGDNVLRARSLAALKRARDKEKRSGRSRPSTPREKQTRDVVVPEAITVAELANRMAEKGADLVKALFKMDMMVTVNQTIDADTAELLVEEFGHRITRVSDADIDIVATEADPEDTLEPRPPVVTIMGHVDHGKTSLLDALRGTDVVAGEAGGITQHIGAYQIHSGGHDITVLDTPGHEAFTEMRMRGANVTDIVVLVVAADDGLMPQTIEAIRHTKAAGVPMIVAINKIDKDGAKPQRVRERLLEHEVVVEDMGGEVQDVEVSALKKTNLDQLVEKIAIQAELMELRANPDRDAEGTVIEAQLDKGRGAVATVLINRGTLKVGDIFVVGSESGKVRALVNDKGERVKEAGPSMPVEVLGLSGVPSAGDTLTVVENEARAREVATYREEQATAQRTAQAPANLENMFSALQDKQKLEIYPVIVKADVQGSAQAIVTALNNLSTDDIRVQVLQSGVGAITESDVLLAAASSAPIIGFNVRPNPNARKLVARDGVEMKYHDVIYRLTEEVAGEMAGQLGPERIETVVGRAEVKEVFPAGKRDKAAGLLVVEGVIRKGIGARLTRQDVIVSQTVIQSLRRFKDDVAEVRVGLECGVLLEGTNDIKPGDQLEVFEVEERARTL